MSKFHGIHGTELQITPASVTENLVVPPAFDEQSTVYALGDGAGSKATAVSEELRKDFASAFWWAFLSCLLIAFIIFIIIVCWLIISSCKIKQEFQQVDDVGAKVGMEGATPDKEKAGVKGATSDKNDSNDNNDLTELTTLNSSQDMKRILLDEYGIEYDLYEIFEKFIPDCSRLNASLELLLSQRAEFYRGLTKNFLSDEFVVQKSSEKYLSECQHVFSRFKNYLAFQNSMVISCDVASKDVIADVQMLQRCIDLFSVTRRNSVQTGESDEHAVFLKNLQAYFEFNEILLNREVEMPGIFSPLLYDENFLTKLGHARDKFLIFEQSMYLKAQDWRGNVLKGDLKERDALMVLDIAKNAIVNFGKCSAGEGLCKKIKRSCRKLKKRKREILKTEEVLLEQLERNDFKAATKIENISKQIDELEKKHERFQNKCGSFAGLLEEIETQKDKELKQYDELVNLLKTTLVCVSGGGVAIDENLIAEERTKIVTMWNAAFYDKLKSQNEVMAADVDFVVLKQKLSTCQQTFEKTQQQQMLKDEVQDLVKSLRVDCEGLAGLSAVCDKFSNDFSKVIERLDQLNQNLDSDLLHPDEDMCLKYIGELGEIVKVYGAIDASQALGDVFNRIASFDSQVQLILRCYEQAKQKLQNFEKILQGQEDGSFEKFLKQVKAELDVVAHMLAYIDSVKGAIRVKNETREYELDGLGNCRPCTPKMVQVFSLNEKHSKVQEYRKKRLEVMGKIDIKKDIVKRDWQPPDSCKSCRLPKISNATVPNPDKQRYFYGPSWRWHMGAHPNDFSSSKKLILSSVRKPTIEDFVNNEKKQTEEQAVFISSDELTDENMYAPFLYNMYGPQHLWPKNNFREMSVEMSVETKKMMQEVALDLDSDFVFEREIIVGGAKTFVSWLVDYNSGGAYDPPWEKNGILKEIFFTYVTPKDEIFDLLSEKTSPEFFICKSVNEPNAYVCGNGGHFAAFRLDKANNTIYFFDSSGAEDICDTKSLGMYGEIRNMLLPCAKLIRVEVAKQPGCCCSMYATANAIYSSFIVKEYEEGKRRCVASALPSSKNLSRNIPPDLWERYRAIQKRVCKIEEEITYTTAIGDDFKNAVRQFEAQKLDYLDVFDDVLKATESKDTFDDFVKNGNSRNGKEYFGKVYDSLINFDSDLMASWIDDTGSNGVLEMPSSSVPQSEVLSSSEYKPTFLWAQRLLGLQSKPECQLGKSGLPKNQITKVPKITCVNQLDPSVITRLMLRDLIVYPEEFIKHYINLQKNKSDIVVECEEFLAEWQADTRIPIAIRREYAQRLRESLHNENDARVWQNINSLLSEIKAVYQEKKATQCGAVDDVILPVTANSIDTADSIKKLLMIMCPQDICSGPANIEACVVEQCDMAGKFNNAAAKRDISLIEFMAKYALDIFKKMHQEVNALKSPKKLIKTLERLRKDFEPLNQVAKQLKAELKQISDKLDQLIDQVTSENIADVGKQIKCFKAQCENIAKSYNEIYAETAKLIANSQQVKRYVESQLNEIKSDADDVKTKSDFLKWNFDASVNFFAGLDDEYQKIKKNNVAKIIGDMCGALRNTEFKTQRTTEVQDKISLLEQKLTTLNKNSTNFLPNEGASGSPIETKSAL